MFCKIFILLIGMSCVGASDTHAPGIGHGGGKPPQELSEAEVQEKYNRISAEIPKCFVDGDTTDLDNLLKDIKSLGTCTFTTRSIIGMIIEMYKGRSNLYSIHLIQELLETAFSYPLSGKQILFRQHQAFVEQCIKAVNEIIPHTQDKARQTERTNFVQYFNGQKFTPARGKAFTLNDNLTLKNTSQPKKAPRIKSDPSMTNLANGLKNEYEGWNKVVS